MFEIPLRNSTFGERGLRPSRGDWTRFLFHRPISRIRFSPLLLKTAKILNTGKSADSELDVIDRDTDFFSQGLSRKVDSAEMNDQRSSLLFLIESVREHSPPNETSGNDSIFSNDTDPEDSVDTLLDDLQAYVKCLTKLRLSLERPARDWAISAPKKFATD